MYLFYLPVAQPLDDAGRIMPGCYLVFYASETTDPEDVYADGSLGTSIGNEVTANAAGRFVPIYPDPTVSYRVQLFNEDDELQFDVDPYFPTAGNWIGEVRMHDGPLDDVPAGWVVCDGTGGTIDSRDRHPRGVGSGTALGDTGGANGTVSGTTDFDGGQSSGVTGGTSITVAQMPTHGHRFLAANNAGDSNADGWLNTNNMGIPGEDVGPFAQRLENEGGTQIIEDSGEGDPHTHTTPAINTHTHDFEASVTAPFFGIYFIKFVGA